MFDATLRSKEASSPSGRVIVEGRADISWVADNETARGVTRLDHLYNSDPLRFLFPRTETGQPQTAVLLTTSGGLVGGDRLEINVTTGPDAEALVMTQAAEKIYRSAGPETAIDVTFDVGRDSWMEWLPHETILFDGARLHRRTRLNLASGARAIAGEILVFGRVASGEVMETGTVREAWEVRRDGRLVWADAFEVNDNWAAVSQAAAGLAGAKAMATIVCATASLDLARDAVRETLKAYETDELRTGATIVGGLVVIRILARDARVLRAAFAETWGSLRTVVGEYGAELPRLWHM